MWTKSFIKWFFFFFFFLNLATGFAICSKGLVKLWKIFIQITHDMQFKNFFPVVNVNIYLIRVSLFKNISYLVQKLIFMTVTISKF